MNKENGQTFNQQAGVPEGIIKELAEIFISGKISEVELLHGDNITTMIGGDSDERKNINIRRLGSNN